MEQRLQHIFIATAAAILALGIGANLVLDGQARSAIRRSIQEDYRGASEVRILKVDRRIGALVGFNQGVTPQTILMVEALQDDGSARWISLETVGAEVPYATLMKQLNTVVGDEQQRREKIKKGGSTGE